MATTGRALALMSAWASDPQPMRGSFIAEGPRRSSRYRFFWVRPNLYRLEALEGDDPGATTIRRDKEIWTLRRGRAHHRREVGGTLTTLDNLLMASFGEPGGRPPLLTGITTVAGRDAALVVVGSPWQGHSDEIEMAIDLATGVLLRRITLMAGKPTLHMETSELEIGIELAEQL